MVFSSATFLYVFLPVVYLLNLLIRNIHARNYMLIAASLLFYAWGEPVYVLLMLASSVFNYLFALLIDRRGKSNADRRAIMVFAVVFNIGMLGVFKYTDFFIATFNSLLGLNIPAANIPLPIGISFYTFQALSYLLDVYFDRYPANKRFSAILLYISFFPQLIAGPIVKYHEIERQIECRTMNVQAGANGLRRFIIGLSMKLLIANKLGSVADIVYGMEASALNSPLAWVGAAAYLFQIYFDFAGYSQMAIGLGEMFGFTIPRNFNYPYISSSMTDFWRRWHISLSTWFREYVYIPLGGNRRGRLRTGVNKMIVFLLTGLWHGASWNFVAWGLYNGLFLMAEGGMVKKKRIRFNPFTWLYTIIAVTLGFVIFRAESMEQAFSVIGAMFTKFSVSGAAAAELSSILSPPVIATFFLACIASTPAAQAASRLLKRWPKTKFMLEYAVAFVLLLVCVMTLSTESYNPFIYFRF